MKKLNVKIIIPIVIVAIVVIVGIVISNNSKETGAGTIGKTKNNVYVEGIENPVSFEEIINTEEENDARFKELYQYKQVKFTATVEEIITDMKNKGSLTVDIIVFKEDWQVEIPAGFCEKLSQLNKGDKIEVNSKILGATGLYGDMVVCDYGTKLSHGKTTIYNRTSIKLNGEEICKIVE